MVLNFFEGAVFDSFDLHDVFDALVGTTFDDGLGFRRTDSKERFEFCLGGSVDVDFALGRRGSLSGAAFGSGSALGR